MKLFNYSIVCRVPDGDDPDPPKPPPSTEEED